MPAEVSATAAGAAQRVVVKQVPVDAVRPLRHLVLRPGKPADTVHTPRDDDAATWHLAAYAGYELVGVMTLFADEPPFAVEGPVERFRWMAVHPDWQGHGVGTVLLREAARRLQARGVHLMWAQGRDSALSFYERRGFRVVGEGFIDPDTNIGHQHVVARVDDVAGLPGG